MCSLAVLKYLESANRPYSANDICQNLHNAYSKGAIQKALDELTEKGSLKEKVYGKQKVYCIIQSEDTQSDDEIHELNRLIDEASEEYKKAERNLKSAEAVLKEISTQPTTEQAKAENDRLGKTNDALSAKLENLKSGSTLVTKEEKSKVQTQHDKISRESRKRKRWVLDLLDAVLENYPKNKAALIEEVGLEM